MRQAILRITICALWAACFTTHITRADDKISSAPAKITTGPEQLQNEYSPSQRKFSGIPSLAIAPCGRMWATWYAGVTPDEDDNNYVVLSTSDDGGKSWKEVLAVDPDGSGPVRAFDPEIWMAPDNTLWLFWAQTVKHDGTISGVWAIKTSECGKENAAWSEPRRLTDGVMMCKPTVISDGQWLLPVSTWRTTDNSAKTVVSRDNGATWRIKGSCNIPEPDRTFDEHMFVERRDGSLWMLARTVYGIGESFSYDKGATWSEFGPSAIKHPTSRFFIRRLASGNLLLVKHGPIGVTTGRSHLMAFLSGDDGTTWSRGLLLDERPGVSYPDGQQTADGRIYIIYDYDRTDAQNILITSFTENDILSPDHDERIIDAFNNRRTVSRGGK